jgi:hypothetical protein
MLLGLPHVKIVELKVLDHHRHGGLRTQGLLAMCLDPSFAASTHPAHYRVHMS